MDAVKFIEERKRVCQTYKDGCVGCPMTGEPCGGFRGVDTKRLVGAVEKWSAAHPRKTRQIVFLEQWPDTQLDTTGNIIICPKQLCKGEELVKLIAKCRGTNCNTCRREFWMKEVE